MTATIGKRSHEADTPTQTRRRRSHQGSGRAITIVLWAYALISLYPLLWLGMQSLRRDRDFFAQPWGFPTRPDASGYINSFRETPLGQYFVNSVLVTAAVVVLSVVCCIGAGYAFSMRRFPGSKAVYSSFIAMLFVPAPILLLPVFLVAGDLHILNSYIGLIGPYVAGTLPIGVYLMKIHFDALPRELTEAAIVDGASDWQVFRHVLVPLIRPAAATVAVLAFLTSWNEYMWALTSIRDAHLYTLPVGLADLASKRYVLGFQTVFSAMVLTTIPVLGVFFLAQRSFIGSITAGAVKG